jgi:hypothetical protein
MAPQDTAEAALSGLASSPRAVKIASERAFNVALDMKNLLEGERNGSAHGLAASVMQRRQ